MLFRSNQLYELDKRKIDYNIIDPADYGFVMSAVNLYTSKRKLLKINIELKNLLKQQIVVGSML